MGLLFVENFTGVGTGATGRTNLLTGVWAAMPSAAAPNTANPRGLGVAHLRMTQLVTGTPSRFVLPGTFNEITLGVAVCLSSLPTSNNSLRIFAPRDSANATQLNLGVSTTGKLEVRRGDTTTIIADSDALHPVPPIVASAYQFVEMYVKIHDTDGEIEVRVDGVVVIDAAGLDTKQTANAGSSQVVVCENSASGVTNFDMADLYVTDGYDFRGDTQWLDVIPNADTAETDWTRNTGSNDYDMISDTAPDADTTYIEATTPGDRSDFELSAVPGTASTIVAVVTKPMMRKTDAGTCNVQVSLMSGGVQVAGADRPMTEAYTYYRDIFETDPNTGVAWTPSAVNAVNLRLDKTA